MSALSFCVRRPNLPLSFLPFLFSGAVLVEDLLVAGRGGVCGLLLGNRCLFGDHRPLRV